VVALSKIRFDGYNILINVVQQKTEDSPQEVIKIPLQMYVNFINDRLAKLEREVRELKESKEAEA
jgi:hypothetical protein